ncbi:uncharacterized protein LAESUDRAFT_687015 [Laetiporus sulphureus 93-53]|uniref:PH domain-containing protein n=1 Tax=Laetiporus sulphureus 93-53 TaxID=1314785 RepID=A0A165BKU3_9APHY|nr:uncharacterized protein LAESUDRAFT_687015 [Laetiporus sulphureus 93-53]KZT01237.1 hypothetical protein LAESUDRAFT_687015 [Laetiporus sulphureus 93-53]
MSASHAGTVAEEVPRSHSAADVRSSQFLIRTSQFLKKASNFRGSKRKSGDAKHKDATVFERSTRSMDLGAKDLAMLANAHTSLHIDRHSRTPSDSSDSGLAQLRNGSHNSLPITTQPHADMTPKTSHDAMPPVPVRTMEDHALESAQAPPQDGMHSASQTERSVHITPSITEYAPTVQMSTSPEIRINDVPSPIDDDDVVQLPTTEDAPLRAALHDRASSVSTPTMAVTPSAHRQSLSSGQISPSLSDRRILAPRLATLPPPMMASFTANGSTRLTPSVVTRHPPMPILNLPTLPPITPNSPIHPPPRAPLRSIPALPMRGPSESAQQGDHDNAMLDEEEDEEGEDYPDASPEREADADAAATDEEGAEEATEMYSSPDTPRSRGDRLTGLPQIDSSPRRTSRTEEFEVNRGNFTPQLDILRASLVCPGSSSPVESDYFTSKRPHTSHTSSAARTPRPSDFIGSSRLRTPALGNVPQIAPMSPGSPRPGLYHLGSRSMVDLLSISKRERDQMATATIDIDDMLEQRGSKLLPGPSTDDDSEQRAPKVRAEPEEPDTPTLRRQRSLPTYRMSSDPPPYPDFHPRRAPPIQPREEEGQERLPSYSNLIYLAAVMPRKLEFVKPGVQARDRKWRRVLCVLDGTAFRVYKCPPGAAGVSAIEEWWEKKVGVGDITVTNTVAVTQSGIVVSAVRGRGPERSGGERPGKTDADDGSDAGSNANQQINPPPQPPVPPSRSKLQLAASLLHPSRSTHSNRSGHSSNDSRASSISHQRVAVSPARPRASMDAPQEDPFAITAVPRNSTEISPTTRQSSFASSNTRSTVSTSPSTTNDSSSFLRSRLLHHAATENSKSLLEPNPKDLIRAYTLQHAESGLASDYTKRKNVIRVRVEGEQFLLQAQDVAAVIDWIEGIQAGTNVALDLDERPMPKGPIFPRRRRRRARAAAAGATGATRVIALQSESGQNATTTATA